MITGAHHGFSFPIKKNWLPFSERVESCIATTVLRHWTGTVPSYINDMFQPSLDRYNARSQITLDISIQKEAQGGKLYLSLDQKYEPKLATVLRM